MKKLSIIAALSIIGTLFSFKAITPGNWTVDKNHAKIGFSISHNMTSDVEGYFKTFDATITTTGDDFSGATFAFSAIAASVNTDNEHRDNNIRNADFLDVEKFPKVIFNSTSVTKKSAATYQIKGNLTLHGVTRPIVLDAVVRIPPAAVGLTKTVAGFKISGVIKRSDFAIGGTFANIMLGDEITINANGEFTKN
ncbi:MAG: YceI family protein [Bacteroidota bacterium]|nr:YceI family protein [Bacteroidota bacterium]